MCIGCTRFERLTKVQRSVLPWRGCTSIRSWSNSRPLICQARSAERRAPSAGRRAARGSALQLAQAARHAEVLAAAAAGDVEAHHRDGAALAVVVVQDELRSRRRSRGSRSRGRRARRGGAGSAGAGRGARAGRRRRRSGSSRGRGRAAGVYERAFDALRNRRRYLRRLTRMRGETAPLTRIVSPRKPMSMLSA